MMQKEWDLLSLSAEINGVAMIIAGLGNQLDHNETDILTPSAMRNVLYGVQAHLERIADDLDTLSISENKQEGGAEHGKE